MYVDSTSQLFANQPLVNRSLQNYKVYTSSDSGFTSMDSLPAAIKSHYSNTTGVDKNAHPLNSIQLEGPTTANNGTSVIPLNTDDCKHTQRRNSSGQKLAKLINILTPYRNRVARRSRSFGDLSKHVKTQPPAQHQHQQHQISNWKFFNSFTSRIPPNGISHPLVNSRTVGPHSKMIHQNRDSIESIYPQSIGDGPVRCTNPVIQTAPSIPESTHTFWHSNSAVTAEDKEPFQQHSTIPCSVQLDLIVQDPTREMYEFRRQWPSAFLSLCTNYLGFLIFTPEELDQIRQQLIREAKSVSHTTTNPWIHTTNGDDSKCEENGTGNYENNHHSRLHSTPRKMLHWLKEHKQTADLELDHWYLMVNTILQYMISNEHYKHNFIFRRPGNHTSVNELEKVLFHTRMKMPTSSSHSNPPHHISDIHSVLEQYDIPVIACLLARMLRYQGMGLIPIYLRRLFIQLVSGVRENIAHQRRTIRLLFQLCPIRLLEQVVKPLFRLMALVAHESKCCQVDETSLAVLFAPIMFLDRDTCTPITLANPLPARVVKIFVRLAKIELELPGANTAKLFQVPALFVHDCQKNLSIHQISDSPALYCSLKYCVTMTPSPRSQGKKCIIQTSANGKLPIPRVNLTAAFMAKRFRSRSPSYSKDCQTPIVKNALHYPTLDFRVRRTPTHNVRSQCLNLTRSPMSAVHMDLAS